MSVIWIFLDGIGLGVDDPEVNPWAGVEGETLIGVAGRPPSWPGAVMRPLDARLGVAGLPQSATGTTALLTGVNAPRELGRHISGFPNQHLRAILAEHSVHRQALARGLRPAFANAYNEAYFRRPASRQSVTTHAVHAAGMPFRMMGDYRAGRAVFHDLTGELIRVQGNEDKLAPPSEEKPRVFKNRFARDREGFAAFAARMEMEVIDPREAGRRVAGLAADHDYVLFEYVKSDMMGHDTGRSWARDVVAEVMLFLRTVLEQMDGERDTLLVASDHGNSEDLTVRTHTLAPVPAVAVGPLAEAILNRCEAITDIVPALLDALAGKRRGG